MTRQLRKPLRWGRTGFRSAGDGGVIHIGPYPLIGMGLTASDKARGRDIVFAVPQWRVIDHTDPAVVEHVMDGERRYRERLARANDAR